MHKVAKIWLVGSLLAFAVGQASAEEDAGKNIRDRLGKMLPDYDVSSVHETAVPGLYEVVLGTELVYVSGDGRYMMQGRMIDLETRADLTEGSPRLAEVRKREAGDRLAALDKVGDDQMVIFAPEKYDHTINVFTDIDCGYCRKLHREIQAYEDEGIRVRYLFFPRAGAGSPSYDKAVSVWCSDNRQEALTESKAGKNLPKKSCDNPVLAHMKLGEKFGIAGTPAIVLDNGELLPGYVPPKRMAALLKASGS
jgi:thiol:disulfide interchange protein DsbC